MESSVKLRQTFLYLINCFFEGLKQNSKFVGGHIFRDWERSERSNTWKKKDLKLSTKTLNRALFNSKKI